MKRPVVLVLLLTFVALVAATAFPPVQPDLEWEFYWDTESPNYDADAPRTWVQWGPQDPNLLQLRPIWMLNDKNPPHINLVPGPVMGPSEFACSIYGPMLAIELLAIAIVGGLLALALHVRERRRRAAAA